MSLNQYRLGDIIDDLFDGVYIVDNKKRITYWNHGAQQLTGYSAKEVIGSRCCDNVLVHVDKQVNNLCDANCPIDASLRDGDYKSTEVYLRHKDGHRISAAVRVRPIRDNLGKVIGAVEIFRDQSYRDAEHQRISKLETLALLDPLTLLPNRRHVETTLRTRLHEMSRYNLPLGTLFIDIDHFKVINDSHGHKMGDRVLKLAAKTMLHSLRPFDMLGRWGGDEFVAIIFNVDDAELLNVADRMRKLIAHSKFHFDTTEFEVTVSIGAALAEPGDTVDLLLDRSDKLLYKSKSSGRNCVSSIPAVLISDEEQEKS